MIRTWRLRIDNGPPVTVTGVRDNIMDMAYDNGALGVSIIEEKVN